MKRRNFIKNLTTTAISAGFTSMLSSCSDLLSEKRALALDITTPDDLFFNISLAEWSLHRSLWSGEVKHLDFTRIAKEKFGISAVEYVNQFFMDKAEDKSYLSEMNTRADDVGVKNLIIMVDMEGSLGSLDEQGRLIAVENHYKWIEAAHFLGCHSIRVNAAGKGKRKEVANAVTDSLGRLCEYGIQDDISIIVENHGGYSSDADWLTGIMEAVDMPNCGTLPDFGNFTINLFPPISYTREKGMKKLMPYARGVSAKSKEFDKSINNHPADFDSLLKIIHDSGFEGYIGIEYEGYKLSEVAGINATKYRLIHSGLKYS